MRWDHVFQVRKLTGRRNFENVQGGKRLYVENFTKLAFFFFYLQSCVIIYTINICKH